MNFYRFKAVLFIIFSCFLLQTALFAQGNVKITIKKKNVTLQEALQDVEKQSAYLVAFNESKLEKTKQIHLNINAEPLEKALTIILSGTGLTYKIKDKYIMIVPAGKPAPEKKTITGVVQDANGEPLIGVNVSVKGGSAGTVTNLNGEFSLQAAKGEILEFSYVGYVAASQTVIERNSLAIIMQEDAKTLDEVVVTALGIKRAEKALSYNVQQINADDILENKDANFVNSLSGKVAGVNINSSSSGVGGASRVIMRGTKSIEQSSNALYVIDGVPMYNSKGEGGTEYGSSGVTEAIADINPEDIESLSVLTGAAAAALYGSDAANGAIIVTTRQGKEGKLSVTVSSSMEFMKAFVMPKFQNRYGSSSGDMSWGDLLSSSSYIGYDPASDYLQGGLVATETVSLSTGTERNQTYFSVGAVDSKGIVPNNGYHRYNFTYRNTTSFLNDKMKLDVGASYIYQKDRNMTNQGVNYNPLIGAYLFPRGNDWEDVEMFERYDPQRKIMTHYFTMDPGEYIIQNPYWINYRNLRENSKNRYMLNASLSYEITDWLNVSGRIRLDNSVNKYTERIFASTPEQLTMLSKNGLYAITRSSDMQIYGDILANINKRFGNDWSLFATLGVSLTDLNYSDTGMRSPLRDGSIEGETTGVANVFNLSNMSNKALEKVENPWREQTRSIFASAEIGYKSTYYLTLTGRNDWPSQLAGPASTSKSFFYPSIGASVIVSEMIPNLSKDYISFLKVRASYASVGNAFKRFVANPVLEWNNTSSTFEQLTNYPVSNLKPERTKSWEFGLTVNFLKYFNADLSYYLTNTYDQLFQPDISVGSGYSTIYVQTGNIRNQGVELALGFKNTWRKFTWNSNLTFSTNNNKIIELGNNLVNPVTGELFSISSLDMKGLGDVHFLLKEGGTLGDMYSSADFVRDDNGNIYVDSEGKVVYEKGIKEPENWKKLGSVLPKGNLAWRNRFDIGNLNVGFMLAARLGGVVYSRTQATLDYYGVSEVSAIARDNGGVRINQSIMDAGDLIEAHSWYNQVAVSGGIPQLYTYDATNVRLQEASIGYTIPRKWLGGVMDIDLSIVGRNLWMIYCKAPFDPENVATTGNYYQGIDYFMMPSTRNIGFNVRLKF